mmetsp:Transcript_80631/g.157568  ORF Transcript_80631/g.157568 Transcript_80631/m.157568 type:complete len:289 (+) Transcript_80631:100-966(+)
MDKYLRPSELYLHVQVPGFAKDVLVAEDAASVSTGCTGLRVWSASEVFAAELAELDFKGQTVVELGCGCGLLGAVVALKGGHVILTDRDQGCLELAKATTEANRLGINAAGGTTSHVPLDWSWPLGVEGIPYGKAHVVVGCELVYDHDSAMKLPVVVKELLAPPSHQRLVDQAAGPQTATAACLPTTITGQEQDSATALPQTTTAASTDMATGGRFLCMLGVRDPTMMTRFITSAYNVGLELVGEPRKVTPSSRALKRAELYHHDIEISNSDHAWTGYIWLEMRLQED